MEHEILQNIDILGSILLKDIPVSKLFLKQEYHLFSAPIKYGILGAKADTSIDMKLRPNCAQSTMLQNPL